MLQYCTVQSKLSNTSTYEGGSGQRGNMPIYAPDIEQIPIVVREVDVSSHEICEGFVGFAQCNAETSGVARSTLIQNHPHAWVLDLSRLRAQGYDEAGNMAWSLNGCAAKICEQYPSAIYVHCSLHALNVYA